MVTEAGSSAFCISFLWTHSITIRYTLITLTIVRVTKAKFGTSTVRKTNHYLIAYV